MAGGFSDWLSSLPSANDLNLSQSWGAKRGSQGYIRGYGGADMAGIGPSKVPAMWQAFAPQAQAMLNQMAGSRRRTALAGSSNARREFERNLYSTFQNQGIDQAFAQRMAARERPQFGYGLQQELGGIETQRLGDSLNLMQAMQNALTQAYSGERDTALQMMLASKNRMASREAAKSAQWAQLGGAALGAAGMALGGPLGGMLGGMAGQRLNPGMAPQGPYAGYGG